MEFEPLEDRTLLAGNFLFVNLDISTGNYVYSLQEFTQNGALVSSVPIPTNPSGDSQARSITVDPSGNVNVFTGTFNAYLSTYSRATKTWTQRTFPEWNTYNVGNYGGVAAYKNYVFATDTTVQNDANGIVRFDSSGGPTVRFANGNDYIAITMGLDGFLYAMNWTSGVGVYDPNTLALVRTIDISRVEYDAREISVDAAGNLYLSQYSSSVRKVDPTGATILAEKQFGNPTGNTSAWVMCLDRDGQIVVGGGDGVIYVSDESLKNVTSFNVGRTLLYSSFNHYIPGPSTPPSPVQENFAVHADNRVFGQMFDASGNPSGNPYLVAHGSLRSVVSARDAAGNLVLFGIDPYLNHVWELKFNSSGNPLTNLYTPVWTGGAVESIAVGHDGSKNLELFAVDPFIHHVWGMKFNANSDPTDSFTLLSMGGVATTLTVGHDGNGNPLLFTIDPYFSQAQEMKFNAAGDPITDFYRPGNAFAVKQIALGSDGHGNPELFAIDPWFGHVFYLNFDANGTATGPYFLQASMGGIAESIGVGHDTNNNPEIFSVGPDFKAYALKFDNNGRPLGDFFYTGQSVVSVTSLQVGIAGNGVQDLFGFGLGDNQIYQETFDVAGNPVNTWFLDAFGAVKSLAVSV